MTAIVKVVDQALKWGWASSQGDIIEYLAEAMELGWRAMPIRNGEGALGTLHVKSVDEAREMVEAPPYRRSD